MNVFLSFCILFIFWCFAYILSIEQRGLRITDEEFLFIVNPSNKTIEVVDVVNSTERPPSVQRTFITK